MSLGRQALIRDASSTVQGGGKRRGGNWIVCPTILAEAFGSSLADAALVYAQELAQIAPLDRGSVALIEER